MEYILNKLLKKSVMASCVAALVCTLTACDHKVSISNNGVVANGSNATASALTKDSTFEQKAAYAIGASLGEYVANLKQGQEQFIGELPTELVINGFSEGIKGQSSLKRNEIETILKDLDKKIQEKLEAEAKKAASDNLNAGKEFLKENAKKEGVVTTASGLQYKVITQGEGKAPKKGDTISVTYRGSTIDGAVFDEQKKPVEFPLDNMIPGWVEGIQLMKVGSEFELYIPSELGYGESAVGQLIKPNSVLIFNVKLVDVKEQKAQELAKPETKAKK